MVLNKKYNVSFSKETIEKVERAAEELGYVPQKRKARKGGRKEKLLVVFCSNLTNPYYVMLLQGIESSAKEQGFGLFVCNTQRDLKMEERYLRMMWGLKPLGIIYTCNPSRCFMGLVEEISRQIPVAIINNQNEKLNVDAVELDNSKLGRMMAAHLLGLGHRKVAYIAPPLTTRQKQRSKRVEGFLKEFAEAGIKDHVIIKAAKEEIDSDIAHIDSEYKIGYELTKELLSETRDITAIVGLNDMIAFGILDALHEAKLKVPGDISVMGCDNTLFARMHKVAAVLHRQQHLGVFGCHPQQGGAPHPKDRPRAPGHNRRRHPGDVPGAQRPGQRGGDRLKGCHPGRALPPLSPPSGEERAQRMPHHRLNIPEGE